MKVRGYKVEFLPLERRLAERRFLDSASGFLYCERRIGERRDILHNELSGQLNFDLDLQNPLIH